MPSSRESYQGTSSPALQMDSLTSEPPGTACNARNLGLIPESGRYPGEGNGSPLQYSCLENSMDKEPGGQSQTQLSS